MVGTTSIESTQTKSPSSLAFPPAVAQRSVVANEPDDALTRVPLEPPFTRAQLKDAIPAHCFERSHLRSFGYLAANLLLVWLTYAAFPRLLALLSPLAPTLLPLALYPAYWFAQGALLTGLWVLAHECGHRAFSPSPIVNDTVGLILHSALLVPYHAWRISHGRHHAYTNHLDRDEVFVPPRVAALLPAAPDEDALPIASAAQRLLAIFLTLTIGWPAYLLFNTSGRPYERRASHFDPASPIFTAKQRPLIVLSDAALLAVLACLGVWAARTSVLHVVLHYVLPYLWVNFWLVLITLLQHSDHALPHYDADGWTWVRGALCTVDRDYGLLNHVFHRIGDTHVAHHLFHEMPHYHAAEATAHIAKVLGPYYRRDETPILKALWAVFRRCAVVAPAPQDGQRDVKGAYWWLSVPQLRQYVKSKVQ